MTSAMMPDEATSPLARGCARLNNMAPAGPTGPPHRRPSFRQVGQDGGQDATYPSLPLMWPTSLRARSTMRRQSLAFSDRAGEYEIGTAIRGKLSALLEVLGHDLGVVEVQLVHQRHAREDQRVRDRQADGQARQQLTKTKIASALFGSRLVGEMSLCRSAGTVKSW